MKTIRAGLLLVLLSSAATAFAGGSQVTLLTNDAFGATSFNTGLNWSDSLAPSGGSDYVVTNGFALRTPASAGDQTFAGLSLTVGDGSSGGLLNYKGTGGSDVITITNFTLNLGVVGNGQGGNFFLAGDVTLGAGGGSFDYGGVGRSITLRAPVGGAGSLTVTNTGAAGNGAVLLVSNSSYLGSTIILAGTLQVGEGGSAGSLGAGGVTNRGTLVFNRGDSYTVTNNISGDAGSLLVRNGDMTLLNSGATNLQLQVPSSAGVVTNVVLNLSNSVVRVLANASGNCNVGGVANVAASGTINMNGGALMTAHELWIAAGAGNSRGYFNLYSGNVLVSNWTGVGRGNGGVNNYGELNISGGSWSNVVNNNITAASFAGNTGVVRVTGGRLYAQNGIYVGESGAGYLNVGNSGVVDVNYLGIGQVNAGVGATVITGGVVQARLSVGVANGAGTTGSLNMGAGQLFANTIYKTGAATINLSGGTLAPYNATANYSVPMTLSTVPDFGGNGVVTFQALGANAVAADINVHEVLSGDGALVKTGPGALLLNAANSYSGPTTVGAGYLFGTGSVISAVTVSNGAFLGPNALARIGTFVIVGNTTLEGGAGVSAFLTGGTPSLVVAGTLTGNADNPVNLLSASPSGVATGTYALIAYAALSGFNFTTGSLPVGVQGYFVDNVGAQTIDFVVTNSSGGLAWSGAVNNQWDANAMTNWVISGTATPAIYNNGDPVLFDDTGANTDVTNTVAVTPGNIAVSNSTLAYSFSGAGINGFGGITKNGTNVLKITSANGYTGTNYVFDGTLVASNVTALGAVAAPTIINGGTLDTGGQNLGGEPVIVSGAGVGGLGAVVNNGAGVTVGLQYVTLAGDTTIGGPNRWDIRNNNATLDLAGYTLTKTGASYIALANTMKATNAGNMVINSGTLSLEFAGSEFSGPGNIVVNPGGTLGLYQAANIWKTNVYNGGTVLSVTGGGTNQIGAPVIINTNTTVDATGGNMSFTNVISGPSGFTKIGANSVMLTATNTYEGPTVISVGSVMVGNGVDANGTLGGGNVTNNSQLIFNRPDSLVVTNAIAGSGQLLARRGETTLLNTSVTNQRLHVLDGYIPSGSAVLNISNSFVTITSNAIRNFSIGLSTNPASTGIVNMVSGTLRATNECWIAAGGGSSRGIINVKGGAVEVISWTAVGRGDGGSGLNNYGELNISGGTWSNVGANHISIASFANNTGRVTVTGGRLYAQNNLYIGESGVGYLSVSSGSVDPNIISMGQNANGQGRFDLSGGTVVTRNVLTVGNAAGSVGTIYQTGGSLTATASDSRLANNATTYAYYRNTGGAFISLGNFQVGASGPGIMEIAGTASASANAGFPVVGRFAGGRGILDVSGGAYAHNNAGTFLIIGEQGSGILNASGSGTVTVHSARTADGLRIAHNLGTGVVSLATGGTIITPAVSRAADVRNIGTFNFDGGTLVANNNNANFFTGLSAANVYSGGARIDDGGNTITVAQPLLAPAGSGVYSIPVLTGGSGYKGPPYVQILGGGSNATALAQIDGTSGALTNIVITSPGTDYTTFPAITLVGGAPATVATLGTPVVTNNPSGGLTKLGAGVLTLTAASTYSGATTVSNGTLALSGTASFTNSQLITVKAGATLSVTGRVDSSFAVGPLRTLRGSGTVQGDVNNDGNVNPGIGAGTLTIAGNYTQTNGTLNIEIGGGTATDYDTLSISGTATLGGTLNVTFINGYTGTVGASFGILAAGSGTGSFAATNLPALGGTRGWDFQNIGGGFIVLSITSAPTVVTGYELYAQQITNGLSGYQDDADGDGYANLLEYVTGANPTNADNYAAMNGIRVGGLLALQFTRTSNSVDTTLIVEGASATTNDASWIGIATNIGGSWGGATNVIETNGPSVFNVTAYDTSPDTNRFLRLRVTRP